MERRVGSDGWHDKTNDLFRVFTAFMQEVGERSFERACVWASLIEFARTWADLEDLQSRLWDMRNR